MIWLLSVQIATYLGMAALFWDMGDWKRGSAAALLAAVQWLFFS